MANGFHDLTNFEGQYWSAHVILTPIKYH